MTKKSEFRVVREHEGDRFYSVGDTRVALAGEVKHLVPHVLELIGDAPDEPEAEGKAEQPLDNKAEGDAPENKTITGPKAKGK